MGMNARLGIGAMDKIAKLIRDERAVSAVEYGLIIAMMVLAMIVGLQLVANSTISMWNGVSANVIASS
jgi:pilus assembly protein Flp/PilA